MIKRKLLSLSLLCGTSLLLAGPTMAKTEGVQKYLERHQQALIGADFVCGDSLTTRINKKVSEAVSGVCAQLDTSIDINNVGYENPQASCDLGLSLPGLPEFDGFGFSAESANACGIVKNIIGDKIQETRRSYEESIQSVADDLSHEETVDYNVIIDEMMK